jgi:hypothetical protein
MKINDNCWRIDKRIPIAVLITIILQIGAVLVWAAELDARVGIVERQIGDTSINEKFGRLEERLDSVKQHIEAIRRQLDQVTGQLFKK